MTTINPALAYAETGLRNTAARIDSAYADFAELLQSIVPMPAAEARELAAVYVKAKLAKVDSVNGRISVRHGAYLEADCVATVRANHAAGKV